MKFTFNWLKEFVEINLAPADLAHALTMAGLEVESFTAALEPETGKEDWLFEISVTPNRGDCLSVAGIAREVAALTKGKLRAPPSGAAAKDAGSQKRISIAIEDPLLCPRYSARLVDEIKIAPSPAWLRHRLESCGIRAINNVVDVTNYVMLETGQPLHAFDLERLQRKSIIVRAAGSAKTFTTLDGVERQLVVDDLLICDGTEPVALAGVMGGINSEVQESTSSVLLESANFSPGAIRRTARRLGLHSEASHRFERGVDPAGTLVALDRAAYLLADIGAGRAAAGTVDHYPGEVKPPTIILREERVERLLGLKLERKEMAELLGGLDMKIKDQARRHSLAIMPPSSRTDITREADVIEELARLLGYDRIPSTLPLLRSEGGKNDPQLNWERKLRDLLAGEGLSEVINLPFTPAWLNASVPGLLPNGTKPVTVLNPLAKEDAEMRRSLVPGLIQNLRLNLSFNARSFHAYHLGKVFGMSAAGDIEERLCVSGLLYGPRARHGLRLPEEQSADFFACKGLVEAILELFHMGEPTVWEWRDTELLHPGKSVHLRYREAPLGYLGQAHPNIIQQLELPSFFLFELDFAKLLEYAPRRITINALPRFPAVERDVALVVDREFASQQVIRWIKDLAEPLIEYVEVFDQYEGAPVPEGKKSLAYKISYRAGERTLTDAEVNDLHRSLVERLGREFGAERRS
jgi:phenylalanyl-tRNA synthetase beta chain